MTGVHKALYRFWSGFSLDGASLSAYLSGHVPDGAALPYITFDVADGDSFAASILTAIVWLKAESGVNVNAQRAQVLDQIARAIPAEGVLLQYSGGTIRLDRNPANFQSYYDDPEDASVIGGRTSYEVRFYHV